MPFAGKQIVFVGDLYQLPPVVKRGSADEYYPEAVWSPKGSI